MIENSADEDRAVAAEARGLVRRALKATIATLGAPGEAATAGWPSAALVTIACAMDGSPILLLSTLAHHTRNLMADARASLLIDGTAGFANPQAGPRVTVMGRILRCDDAGFARRFLARHPAARTYAGFGDFAFYRMEVERLHSVGGFARARWLDVGDAILPEIAWREIAAHEHEVLAHMNEDHADALSLYAQHFLKTRAKRVRLLAVDPEGLDLRCGRAIHRIDFPHAVTDLTQLRTALVALAHGARAAADA